MKKIAIIKLGTLEIKMNIVEIMQNQTFLPLEDHRESTKIIEDFDNDIPISKTRLNEVLGTLNNFKAICNSKKIEEFYCYAEYNYKNLKNEHSFFEQINSKTGFRFNILSEKEHIDYIYASVVSSINITKGVFVNIDENKSYIIQYNRRMILNQLVLPFGYASYLSKLKETSCELKYETIKNDVDAIFNSVEGEWIKALPPETITVLQGDVFKNISKLVRKQTRYPFDKDQNFTTNKQDVLTVCDILKDMPFDDKKKLKGTTFRADAMVVGAMLSKAILSNLRYLDIVIKQIQEPIDNPLLEDADTIVDLQENNEEVAEDILVENETDELINLDNLVICEFELLHGVVFKMLNENNSLPYILESSLSATSFYYNQNSNADYVCKLSCMIFKQLKVLHKLNRYYMNVLKIASKLYDAGARINPTEMDKFGYFALINSPIYGVTHREILLAGFVLMFQSNDNFALTEWAKYKPILLKGNEDELELKLACQRLAVILKLARAFDKYSNSRITDIACDNLGECVIMKTTMSTNSLLEIREAKKLENEFRKVFNNKKIEIL
ncbi:MAG: hypothetical protein IJW82_00575 [Clostridia bacterium]|nr:hypothetical protein [Clostridia bacterium]